MTLAIQRERTPEGFFVRLSGNLNARMASAVLEAIISAPDLSVVVDLSDLNSLDEDGMRALTEASHRLARDGKAMIVVGASDEVIGAIRSPEVTLSPENVQQPSSGVRSVQH